MESASNYTILSLGRTGTGKSSFGNIIFCNGNPANYQQIFIEGSGFGPETSATTIITKNNDGRTITYIDTPGMYGYNFDKTELINQIDSISIIAFCIALPGFLMGNNYDVFKYYHDLLHEIIIPG